MPTIPNLQDIYDAWLGHGGLSSTFTIQSTDCSGGYPLGSSSAPSWPGLRGWARASSPTPSTPSWHNPFYTHRHPTPPCTADFTCTFLKHLLLYNNWSFNSCCSLPCFTSKGFAKSSIFTCPNICMLLIPWRKHVRCKCLQGWTFKNTFSQVGRKRPALIYKSHKNKIQAQAKPARCMTADGRKVWSNTTDVWEQGKPILPVKSDMIWFHASYKKKGLKGQPCLKPRKGICTKTLTHSVKPFSLHRLTENVGYFTRGYA